MRYAMTVLILVLGVSGCCVPTAQCDLECEDTCYVNVEGQAECRQSCETFLDCQEKGPYWWCADSVCWIAGNPPQGLIDSCDADPLSDACCEQYPSDPSCDPR